MPFFNSNVLFMLYIYMHVRYNISYIIRKVLIIYKDVIVARTYVCICIHIYIYIHMHIRTYIYDIYV